MARLLSDKAVRDRVLMEGFDFALLHFYGYPDTLPQFENRKLVTAWVKARKALTPLLKLLDLTEDY